MLRKCGFANIEHGSLPDRPRCKSLRGEIVLECPHRPQNAGHERPGAGRGISALTLGRATADHPAARRCSGKSLMAQSRRSRDGAPARILFKAHAGNLLALNAVITRLLRARGSRRTVRIATKKPRPPRPGLSFEEERARGSITTGQVVGREAGAYAGMRSSASVGSRST